MPVLPVTDPVLIFFIVMVVILTAPLAMARLRGPALVGLILAGVIVGPSVLGLLERDATIILLGTVGLLYLMFVAGVSLDLTQFAQLRNWSIGFGLMSFLIPQMGALVVGVQVLGFTYPQALLLGSIVGSHTLLAFQIVDRLGITENRGMIMAMGATIVTDLLSLVILAIVVAAVVGDPSPEYWIRFGATVGLWAAALIILLPRAGYWFFRNVRQGPVIDFAFLMAILFLAAWTAELVGLAPIIGAFTAGLLMNRLVPPRSPLMTRIKFVGDALFIPFFLISVGMLIDVRVVFSSLTIWVWALTFSALVIGGKTLAAKGAQWLSKGSAAEGWTVAGLTIPQAAATLAVTLVGFEIGLFSELVVNAVVVMILITSIVGPALVERFGREVALQERERAYEPAKAPQRILVPLANPATAETLMELAMAIRRADSQEPLYPLTVAREGPEEEAAVEAAERLLGHAVVHAAAADVPVVPITRVDHNIARGIERAVRERRISTVVFGWEGEARTRSLIFGSVLDQFLEETSAMVLVSRLVHPLQATERVMVLIPPYAEREAGFVPALAALKTMASRAGAEILFFCVRDSEPSITAWAERTGPEVDFEVRLLDTWPRVVPELADEVSVGDTIVLVSTRRGTVTWRPDLLRLPRQLASRYDDHDMITLYLPQQRLADGTAVITPHVDLPSLPQRNVVMDLQDGSLADIIEQTLSQGEWSHQSQVRRLADRIAERQVDYAPELSPGLVLYHLHTTEVRESQLFMGVSKEGVYLPQTTARVHLVLVILAPRELTANAYLHQLATTAQVLHRPGIVEDVVQADSAEEAKERLLRGPEPIRDGEMASTGQP